MTVRVRRSGKSLGILRAVAGAACLPIIYMAAYLSLPYLRPGLEQAALLSARISFPAEEDTLSAEAAGGSLRDGVTSELSPLAGPENVEFSPADDYLKNLVPVEEETPEAPAAQKPAPSKPADAGTIHRKTYTAGTGNVYIPLNDGYIKNCTTLSAASILETVGKQPAFTIAADGKPEVLIMHTHATEAYQDQELDWYDKAYNSRTTDTSRNTCAVGDAIQRQLEAAGIGVLHDKTLHDYPSYNGAYERSAETVKSYLAKYPSIKVVLDVHRDAIQPDNSTMVAPVTTIDGRSCAQVMIISGCDNGSFNMPNYLENLKLSAALQRQLEADYPSLARPILFDYRKYNQDLTTGSILLEMGGHANTLDEAVYCGELVGKSLAKTLLALK